MVGRVTAYIEPLAPRKLRAVNRRPGSSCSSAWLHNRSLFTSWAVYSLCIRFLCV